MGIGVERKELGRKYLRRSGDELGETGVACGSEEVCCAREEGQGTLELVDLLEKTRRSAAEKYQTRETLEGKRPTGRTPDFIDYFYLISV